MKIEFGNGSEPPKAYDDDGNETGLPGWAMHSWVTGHSVKVDGENDEPRCADCPWPDPAPAIRACPTCHGTGRLP